MLIKNNYRIKIKIKKSTTKTKCWGKTIFPVPLKKLEGKARNVKGKVVRI